jgi:peptidoglycan/xylan/chitin deacetylase (PgdA/CDA1 family)
VDLGNLGLGRHSLADVAARDAAARTVVERMKTMGGAQRAPAIAAIHEILDATSAVPFEAFSLMSWDEVGELERGGTFRFGAHTVDHEIVSRLDDAALERQIRASIEAVARHARQPSRTFAYPNGRRQDFDARAAGIIRAAGGTAAVSTISGLNSARTDPFALRRLTVGADMSFDEFRLRASGLLWSPADD